MNIRYIYPSELELDEAIEYYNYQLPGLGSEFYNEINRTIERISRFPKAWAKVGLYTRRCLLKQFPYAILYTIDNNDDILILAIANMHRNPLYYKDRIL
jgi:hypothetical protein